ncbi:hypothetical protein DTO96_102426 [Ephemeroptericola cinctiostellae]|uniref:Uncharacterized protein n=1 Tax=Ephemeroptericola cinctiostellae TaxID=2268024 RepID=A0A345DE83_9BURK|nr:hypothetical protein [Ephemeroptericola cinctiostellae]AXF86671.1 hypothetical protein DTO96_102426 [Ephemeroptericola cinctiostellae]
MGREVRRVPADWLHPKNERTGNYKPLINNYFYSETAEEWMTEVRENGLQAALDEYGNPPDKNDYMPMWDENEKNHYMMYEDTSEGTPISPAFQTGEELAKWLVDSGAPYLAFQTASYDQWMHVIRGGIVMMTVTIADITSETYSPTENSSQQ